MAIVEQIFQDELTDGVANTRPHQELLIEGQPDERALGAAIAAVIGHRVAASGLRVALRPDPHAGASRQIRADHRGQKRVGLVEQA